MAEYKPFIDELFAGAEFLMWEISAQNNCFTNYEFLRKTSQRHQGAYVQLLHAVFEHRGADYLFNIAHENIGRKLRQIAENAGYEVEKNSHRQEKNIFGDDTTADSE
jgi:hypothetical protein